MDVDASGSINYSEFITATVNRQKMLSKDKLEMIFNVFDKVSLLFSLKNYFLIFFFNFFMTNLMNKRIKVEV